jgi:Nitrile hydratase beta subunit
MTAPDPQRSHHDMGGLPAGTVVASEHDYAIWEKRVDALLVLLSGRDEPLVSTDELRRNIESLGSEAYQRMFYYERWIFAIAQTLVQRGVITVDELGRKIAEVCARESAHD